MQCSSIHISFQCSSVGTWRRALLNSHTRRAASEHRSMTHLALALALALAFGLRLGLGFGFANVTRTCAWPYPCPRCPRPTLIVVNPDEALCATGSVEDAAFVVSFLTPSFASLRSSFKVNSSGIISGFNAVHCTANFPLAMCVGMPMEMHKLSLECGHFCLFWHCLQFRLRPTRSCKNVF